MTTRTDLPMPPMPPVTVADEGGGGGGSHWVQLITARGDIDAHLLAGRLNEAGIETRTIKDHSGPTWLYGGSDPWGPVALWVRRSQYEESRIVLAEMAYDAPAAVKDAGPLGWSPTTWWIAAISLGLLLTGIGFARSAEYVERCGFQLSCPQPEPRP